MPDLEIGLKGSKELVVGPEHLASFMGNIGADVLSTHHVVLLMELAARQAIESRLPKDSMTVGTRVIARHRAATPLGGKVRAEATLRAIEGLKKLIFDVVVFDEFETLAEGENEQMIVSIDKFLKKVGAKKDH